jgi:hypothetical protein
MLVLVLEKKICISSLKNHLPLYRSVYQGKSLPKK